MRVLVCGADSSVAIVIQLISSLYYILFNPTQLKEINQCSFKCPITTIFFAFAQHLHNGMGCRVVIVLGHSIGSVLATSPLY